MNPLKWLLRRRGRAVTWLLLTDWAILIATFMVALYFRRYDPKMNIISIRNLRVVPEVSLVAIYSLVMLVAFTLVGLYLRKTWLSRWYHALCILEATTYVTLGYLLLRGATKLPYLVPSRRVIFYWYGLMTLGLLIHRLFIFNWLLRFAQSRGLARRVVLIGDSHVTNDFIAKWRDGESYSGLEPIGLLSDKEVAPLNISLPRLGRICDLERVTQEHRIEGAVICNPNIGYDALMDLIERCIRLFGWVDVHTDKSAVWHSRPNADKYFDIPFARLRPVPNSRLYRLYRRIFDIAAAGTALILLSPFLAVIAVLVKLSSPGPVFYARERIGKDGRPFKFYKFRSMRVGADQDESRRAAILAHIKEGKAGGKVVNEAMVTPIGRFIRKWGIDEIPQLWNVIKGDMTLVGPRPLPPEEYEAQDEWQKKRFNVTPGCTGLWKVMVARESGMTFASTVLYDLYYARNMNPLLDLYILLQTAWVVLSGRADAR